MPFERLNNKPPTPKVKPCARCGGDRPANLRKVLALVGTGKLESHSFCAQCVPLCPQVVLGYASLQQRQCMKQSGHGGFCANALHQSWHRGDAKPHKYEPLAMEQPV